MAAVIPIRRCRRGAPPVSDHWGPWDLLSLVVRTHEPHRFAQVGIDLQVRPPHAPEEHVRRGLIVAL